MHGAFAVVTLRSSGCASQRRPARLCTALDRRRVGDTRRALWTFRSPRAIFGLLGRVVLASPASPSTAPPTRCPAASNGSRYRRGRRAAGKPRCAATRPRCSPATALDLAQDDLVCAAPTPPGRTARGTLWKETHAFRDEQRQQMPRSDFRCGPRGDGSWHSFQVRATDLRGYAARAGPPSTSVPRSSSALWATGPRHGSAAARRSGPALEDRRRHVARAGGSQAGPASRRSLGRGPE